jgi:1-phosphofructokinase family hexose kinase
LIVTLTVNPALDHTVTVDRLAFEDRASILSTMEGAGGRGINASAVIHSFGGQTLAILPSGGDTGRLLEEDLATKGFPIEVVRIRNETRINLTITDRQGLTVKLNARGPNLDSEELARVEEAVRQRVLGASWLLLCGSLPPGVPCAFYSRLIRLAKTHGVKTLVDTDGEPLQEALEAGPTVVAPNQQEAERLLNKALLTRAHFLEAAERIKAMGAESVVLSLGSRGAVGATDAEVSEVVAPRVDAVCPIGAGDALNAAFAWAMVQGHPFVDAARWGVAAGTASARLPGISFATLDQTREIYRQVEVRPATEFPVSASGETGRTGSGV